jgi:hypothetical protein
VNDRAEISASVRKRHAELFIFSNEWFHRQILKYRL